MNRRCVSLSILLCTLWALSISVYAAVVESENDPTNMTISEFRSSYTDPVILELLGVDSSDNVVKMYNISVVDAFHDYRSITDVLSSEYYNQILYVVVTDNKEPTVYFAKPRKGEEIPVKAHDDNLVQSKDLSAYFDETLIKSISPNITVYNVYYIWSVPDREGISIYYETDLGDFVYYHNGGEYLMPINAFCDYMNILYNRTYGLDEDTGSESAFNLSIYNLRSSSFDPGAWVENIKVTPEPVDSDPGKPDNTPWIIAASGAAAAVVAAAAVLILRKRKASRA